MAAMATCGRFYRRALAIRLFSNNVVAAAEGVTIVGCESTAERALTALQEAQRLNPNRLNSCALEDCHLTKN